jgi:hypothetical protein
MFQDIRADKPAQRHEWHAFFRCLQRRMQRRAGGVLHFDRARFDGGREARRRTKLTEAHRARFKRFDTAGADQQISLQARGWQCHEVYAFHTTPYERAGRRHRHARNLARHHQQAAVANRR